MITTKNLKLVPLELVHIRAFLRSKSDLAEILQVTVPKNWPHFPEAFSLPPDDSDTSDFGSTKWHGYFFIYPKENVLVGNGGFKSPPGESGIVEIGYEIAPEYWNRGFATEAAQAMIKYAFSEREVQAIIAHTLANKNASNTVLKKAGMTFQEELEDPDDGKIWRWRITRNEYELDLKKEKNLL